MSAFTGGDWTVTGQSEGGRYITVKSSNGRTVARVPFNTERECAGGPLTDAGDAALIAAAPNLLKELCLLIEAADERGIRTDGAKAAVDKARDGAA